MDAMSRISQIRSKSWLNINTLLGVGGSRNAKPSDPNLFLSQLEGRLDNLKKGRTTRADLVVDEQIASRNNSVNETLASQDPTLLKSYNSLLSGLTYSQSARIVSDVEYTIRTLKQIPTEEEARASTNKVVAAYRENAEKRKNAITL